MLRVINAPHDNCIYGSMEMIFRAPLQQHYMHDDEIELIDYVSDKLFLSGGVPVTPYFRTLPPTRIGGDDNNVSFSVIRLDHVMLHPMEICNVVCSAGTFQVYIENNSLYLKFVYGGWFVDLNRLAHKKIKPKKLKHTLARMWKKEMLAKGILDYLNVLFETLDIIERLPSEAPVPCIVLNENVRMDCLHAIQFVDCQVETHYIQKEADLTLVHFPGADACNDIMDWYMPLYYDNPEDHGYEYDEIAGAWLPQESENEKELLYFYMDCGGDTPIYGRPEEDMGYFGADGN